MIGNADEVVEGALRLYPVEALQKQLKELIEPTPSTTESQREKEVREDPDFSLTALSVATDESDSDYDPPESSPCNRGKRLQDRGRARRQ